MGGEDSEVHRLVSALDYPMFIVTVAAAGERAGCLVGFTTQCSIDPPRFLVCLSDKNRTFRIARDAQTMVVHLVPGEATELADLFGGETGDDVDKFTRASWHSGPGETPVLDECENWFAARIVDRIPAGDHCAYLLEPTEAHGEEDQTPFNFHRAQRIEPGHEA